MGTTVDKTVSKLQNELELWGAKLNELLAKADVASKEATIEARKHLDDATDKLAAARRKLEEAKAAGEDKWEEFKVGLERSWKDLERAFHKLAH